MRSTTGESLGDACLLTPTWAGDRARFALLRASLERSSLAGLPHYAVVHTEDLPLFDAPTGSLQLHSTAEMLPADLEQQRLRASALARRLGGRLTKLCGSLAKRTGGWPTWVRYTGWHTQQLTKLAAAAQSKHEAVVVMDSDLVVLPGARVADFTHPQGRIRCFEGQEEPADFAGRQAKWNRQAHWLLGIPYEPEHYYDTCFETPFVFHPPTVRAMFEWLERRYRQPWWKCLLAQPPRDWSEFATYRLFLKRHVDQHKVAWQPDSFFAYLEQDAAGGRFRERIDRILENPQPHYLTIHSQGTAYEGETQVATVLKSLDRAYARLEQRWPPSGRGSAVQGSAGERRVSG